MCGRFQLSVKGKEISERFNTEVFDAFYKPNFNCAPTQRLPVIINSEARKLNFFQWGLVPSWAKDTRIGSKMINSRAETVAEKPAFRKAFAARRCLVPANGFYEWKQGKVKVPYRFYLPDEPLFAMAGIWENWYDGGGNVLQSFSILTTSANALMQPVHHRMPVIISRRDEALWLNATDQEVLLQLLKPFPEQLMRCHQVSNRVNNAGINEESLVVPVPEFPNDLFEASPP
ncbi:MAG: SOS response-associated peptidase [Bacteroidales bacterium]|nr:SOS response-associated peptidase [Bacteroidales bacterium]